MILFVVMTLLGLPIDGGPRTARRRGNAAAEHGASGRAEAGSGPEGGDGAP